MDIHPGGMKVKNDGLRYNVYATYPVPGKHSYHGSYKVTYPNKQHEEFSWYREIEVVK